MDMDGMHSSESTQSRVEAAPSERPWPTRVLLAGEEERGDEPHIHRGID